MGHSSELMINDSMSQVAEYYDEICSPCSNNRIVFIQAIMERYCEPQSAFLDVACSTGETLLKLHNSKYLFYGSDISNGMIKCAKKKAQLNSKDIVFFTADMRDINEIADTFNCVYNNSIYWLSSVDEINKCLSAVYRALNNKGVFVLEMLNPMNFFSNNVDAFFSYKRNKELEFHKSTLLHSRENENITISQVYTVFNSETFETLSSGFVLTLTLLELEDMKRLLVSKGFEILDIYYDYKQQESNCKYYQLVCRSNK